MSDQDENERVLRQARLLGEGSLNDLDRWRLRGARAEEERAKQQAEERKQRSDAVEVLRAELRQK